jgi:hypothetical protein
LITTERFAKNADQFFVRYPTAAAMSLLPLRTFNAMENAMYVHLTNTQVIIGGFALFLIIIFALAAFLDKLWRTEAPLREFGTLTTNPIPSGKAPAATTKMGRANSTRVMQI